MTESKRMSFFDVVMECYDNKELVAQFERLYGVKISDWRPPRNGIEALVDKVCGFTPASINEEAAHRFVRFVWDCAWTRLPPECFSFEVCEDENCEHTHVFVRDGEP